MTIDIRPLGFALGAEVQSFDPRAMDAVTLQELQAAWSKYHVLVFPKAGGLSKKDFMRFASGFGELDLNEFQPKTDRDPQHPEILYVTNRNRPDGKPSDTRNAGRNWHTDQAHTLRPTKASMLMCVEKPDVGGDTLFSNLEMAYETLSPLLRRFLDGLETVHDVSLVKGLDQRNPDAVAELRRLCPPVIQPLIRTHPETGKRSLLLGQRISGIVGMNDFESQPLLEMLNEHAARPDFCYRHRWSVGDILLWDNRSTQHLALPDFDQNQTRHMMRCSLVGLPSGRVVAAKAPEVTSVERVVAAVS